MIEFKIPSMTCGHCVGAVTEAVQQLDAAANVKVDLAEHSVQIESTRPRGELAAALKQAGYAPA